MDIATIAGIVAGFAFIIITIMMGDSDASFVDIPSVMIVVGGSMAATFVSYPMDKAVAIIKVTMKAIFTDQSNDSETVRTFIDLANLARRDGILALDRQLKEIDNVFLKSGLEMAVDGTDPDTIRDVMETEIESLQDRHKDGEGLFTALGSYAPAFGMIGTLVGLVKMLGNLDDPSSIGPAMSIALITTFYGAVLGNLVYLPIATKLKLKSKSEVNSKIMIIEGVLAIQRGVHPRTIERKLMNYMPPSLRGGGEEESAE